ncbi:hypothetical protein SAY87_016537 [Trapa incisa]|uniref:Uncharacterized protein n=1 Tax=Trapa incisa TaxID=236973 RepID=A0AAN7L6Z7_9MYRT|nr:hypothetical protein SAY87_016537 [Trapa incisa]
MRVQEEVKSSLQGDGQMEYDVLFWEALKGTFFYSASPDHPSQDQMGSASLHRRPQTLRSIFLLIPLILLLLLLLLGQHCRGSRPYPAARNEFKIRPKSRGAYGDAGHFIGFLPRGFPIPASGPSRKHNDIGLQSLHASP